MEYTMLKDRKIHYVQGQFSLNLLNDQCNSNGTQAELLFFGGNWKS